MSTSVIQNKLGQFCGSLIVDKPYDLFMFFNESEVSNEVLLM